MSSASPSLPPVKPEPDPPPMKLGLPRLPNRNNVHRHTLAQWGVLAALFLMCHELRGPIVSVARSWGIPIPFAVGSEAPQEEPKRANRVHHGRDH